MFENASRKTVVRAIDTHRIKKGEFGYPKGGFGDMDEPEELWRVSLSVQEGIWPPTQIKSSFLSRDEAEKFMRDHPVGSEYSREIFVTQGFTFDDWLNAGRFPIESGDVSSDLPLRVLKEAGISDASGQTISRNVADTLGPDRIRELKERYSLDWGAAAAFEYCFFNLPKTSPACLAAACRFYYFIMEDRFKAGYLLRDLEVLVYGVEEKATWAIETHLKAGAGGSKASTEARAKRRKALWAALENIVARNPEIVKLGHRSMVKLALSQATETDPELWTRGKAQANEYLGEIRRGEAGEDLLMCYRAIFEPDRLSG